jgi:hypothetical protein
MKFKKKSNNKKTNRRGSKHNKLRTKIFDGDEGGGGGEYLEHLDNSHLKLS